MKHKNRKANRKQREKQSDSIPQHTCPNCGFKASSKFALKEHRLEVCHG